MVSCKGMSPLWRQDPTSNTIPFLSLTIYLEDKDVDMFQPKMGCSLSFSGM